MSRHAACYRGNPLHHRWIGAHFCSGRESTSCRWATHGGATCSLEPSGPSIYHTKPPHTCPALSLHHAWPHLSRERVWLCCACAGGDESGWRRSSPSVQPAGRSALAASCSQLGRSIQASFRGLWARRIRSEARHAALYVLGGGLQNYITRVSGHVRLCWCLLVLRSSNRTY